jgi:hypothetical protein
VGPLEPRRDRLQGAYDGQRPMAIIRRLWQAAGESSTFGALLKMLLLTAQRREKVTTMRWDDVSVSVANGVGALAVLVVEDDFFVRCDVAGCLREAGYTVIETESGELPSHCANQK